MIGTRCRIEGTSWASMSSETRWEGADILIASVKHHSSSSTTA